MTSYCYSLTGNFPNATIAASKFHDEVDVAITGTQFSYVNVYGDAVCAYFSSSLSPLEISILDSIVTLHDGVPYSNYGANYEDFVTLDGSRSMSGSLQMSGNSIIGANEYNGVVVEYHGARHEFTGSDELNGDRLGIDYVPISYVPKANIPEAGNVKNLSAHLAGIDQAISSSISSVIFGTNFANYESNAVFSTTAQTFQTSSIMNFVCSSSGDYRIGWMYLWKYDDVSSDIQVAVKLDNSIDLLYPFHTEEPSDKRSEQRHQNSGFKHRYLNSGSHNVSLLVRSTKSKINATIYYSSIEFWRV